MVLLTPNFVDVTAEALTIGIVRMKFRPIEGWPVPVFAPA
jgi:hypothetical protein